MSNMLNNSQVTITFVLPASCETLTCLISSLSDKGAASRHLLAPPIGSMCKFQ